MTAFPAVVDPAAQASAEADAAPTLTISALTAPSAPASAEAALARLRRRVSGPDADWKRALLEAIAGWPLATETVDGVRLDYLIGGEAFDWRLLAARLGWALGDAVDAGTLAAWLSEPDPSGGFSDTDFTRLLGAEKHRGHLSYLYGVVVERALLAAMEQEITKRRVASGQPPTELARDEAFERLYEGTQESLWAAFLSDDKGAERGRHGPKHEHLSLGDSDAFTYWLFKLRLKRAEPARVASDTRKGLNHLERMRAAHERRLRALLTEGSFEPDAHDKKSRRTAANARPRRQKAPAYARG
jgi:hypothetical protein